MRKRKKKNPAELVLMGANPLRCVNTNFSTDEKLTLGRLGISWKAIQTPSDVRKARKALKDARKIRSRFKNPQEMSLSEQREKAQEIYTGFHAIPPENKIVLDEPHIPAGVYPELGLLVYITFKPTHPNAVDHYEKSYVSPSESTHVIGKLTRDQIYFAGGDQRINEKALRSFGWDGEATFEIGEARVCAYLAQKYHKAIQEDARGELIEWFHPFGEETGVLPTLCYDHTNTRLYLKHGEYRIRDEGIVN